MKKKNYTLASATIVGLAIATSGGAAFADESTPAPATSPVAAPSSVPSEAPVSPTTGDAKPAVQSTDSTEPSSAAAPKTTEKDIVLVHTNDVHGRIVEEKGRDKNTSVVGDAKLATVIENERAKKYQTTVVLDAGDAFQGLPISNSTKGEARAEILNKMNYDAMAVGNHEFDFGLDEAKKYKQILKFPLLSSKGYNTVETSKKDGITTHVYGVKKSRGTNTERKLPNTGINSVATVSFGVVALLAAVVLRKRKNR